tara:strand:+ start:526 stop:699 length:174 start_codon:yes stop_codon:yes gene_type:complete
MHIVYSDIIPRPDLAPAHIENDANGLAVHILTDNEITNLHIYNIAYFALDVKQVGVK